MPFTVESPETGAMALIRADINAEKKRVNAYIVWIVGLPSDRDHVMLRDCLDDAMREFATSIWGAEGPWELKVIYISPNELPDVTKKGSVK